MTKDCDEGLRQVKIATWEALRKQRLEEEKRREKEKANSADGKPPAPTNRPS